MAIQIVEIFGRSIQGDREIYRDRLASAFAELDPASDNVPSVWWTVVNGVPTRFNRDTVREFLRRFMNNDFWRVA